MEQSTQPVTPVPAAPMSNNMSGTQHDKKTTKLVVILSLVLVAVIIIFIILLVMWQGNNMTINNTTNTPTSYTYEPQNLNFNSSDGESTVNKVIDDTDKALDTTTNDSNFVNVNLQ